MIPMMLFLLGASGSLPPQEAAHPAQATTTAASDQSVNGGAKQRVDTSAPRTTEKREHWSDGMNTKRSPDPRKRDEYGAPKVTPPQGQGTDNPGGIPEPRKHPPRPKTGGGQDG
ncbi:hypothetical protein ACQKIE_03410 [Luteibacter sp. NPDC031894]|jgi:hypothetical protein|uniref:hypothetical protein n=1 Tax=Luteibacter sp. NPDC031894 TaxID=3390572 RepID=UPI003D0584D9